jgi:hypothetical protein
LEEAFATAIRFESYRASSDVLTADEGSQHKVRAANLPMTENFGDRLDRLEAAVAKFSNTVQNWQSQVQASKPARSTESWVARQHPQAVASDVTNVRQQAANSASFAKSRRTCYVCGQSGHLMRNCPNHRPRSQGNESSKEGSGFGQPNVRAAKVADRDDGEQPDYDYGSVRSDPLSSGK